MHVVVQTLQSGNNNIQSTEFNNTLNHKITSRTYALSIISKTADVRVGMGTGTGDSKKKENKKRRKK